MKARKPQRNDLALLGAPVDLSRGFSGQPGLYRIERIDFDEEGQPKVFHLADPTNQEIAWSVPFPPDRVIGVYANTLEVPK